MDTLTKREHLRNFRREEEVGNLFGEEVEGIGKSIIDLIKKEGITYEQAYASLQFAYDTLKFESNFVQVK